MITCDFANCRDMTCYQSRIWASSPDEAAVKIREKYPEGKLTIRETHIPKWWEYTVVV